MRRFDKLQHIRKVNLLTEERYLESKMSANEAAFKAAILELNGDLRGIPEDKEDINEVMMTTIAIILSVGKFVDLIAVTMALGSSRSTDRFMTSAATSNRACLKPIG